MREIRVKLGEVMAQRRVNRKQLSDATGIRYATLSDVYSGKRRPTLETLEAVLNGLESLSGRPVALTDVLEVVDVPAEVDAETRAWMDSDLSRLGEYEPYDWGDEDPNTVGQPVTIGPDGRVVIGEEGR